MTVLFFGFAATVAAATPSSAAGLTVLFFGFAAVAAATLSSAAGLTVLFFSFAAVAAAATPSSAAGWAGSSSSIFTADSTSALSSAVISVGFSANSAMGTSSASSLVLTADSAVVSSISGFLRSGKISSLNIQTFTPIRPKVVCASVKP